MAIVSPATVKCMFLPVPLREAEPATEATDFLCTVLAFVEADAFGTEWTEAPSLASESSLDIFPRAITAPLTHATANGVPRRRVR